MRLAPEEAVRFADSDSNFAAAGSNILRHILLLIGRIFFQMWDSIRLGMQEGVKFNRVKRRQPNPVAKISKKLSNTNSLSHFTIRLTIFYTDIFDICIPPHKTTSIIYLCHKVCAVTLSHKTWKEVKESLLGFYLSVKQAKHCPDRETFMSWCDFCEDTMCTGQTQCMKVKEATHQIMPLPKVGCVFL